MNELHSTDSTTLRQQALCNRERAQRARRVATYLPRASARRNLEGIALDMEREAQELERRAEVLN
jgi:hypothetical protein